MAVIGSAGGVMLAVVDTAAWVGLVLAATTVAIAAASARWARQSARAARETVQPMKDVASSVSESVKLQGAGILEEKRLLAAMEASNTTSRRIADEQHLDRVLARLETVGELLFDMQEGVFQRQEHMPDIHLRTAQTRLTARLAAFPAGQLPLTRTACRLSPTRSPSDFLEAIEPALREVAEACDSVNVAIRALRFEVGEDPDGEPAARGGFRGGPGGR